MAIKLIGIVIELFGEVTELVVMAIKLIGIVIELVGMVTELVIMHGN